MQWKILRLARLGSAVERLGGRQVRGAVLGRPLPLALAQEVERRREGVGVDRRLDLEDLRARGRGATLPIRQMLLCRALWSRWPIRLRVFCSDSGLWWKLRQRYEASPVVIDFHPPSIADLVDVGVDDQIGVGGPLVDLDDLALVGGADHGQVVVVLGVVLVEHAARLEGVVDAVAEHVAQLVLVHPAVQAEGGDDVDVVDAGRGGEVEHGLDHALAVVGACASWAARGWRRRTRSSASCRAAAAPAAAPCRSGRARRCGSRRRGRRSPASGSGG